MATPLSEPRAARGSDARESGAGATGRDPLAEARPAAELLLDRLVARDFTGFDPYDGLAARRLWLRPALRSRAGRLAVIQAVRRSPWNLRRLAAVPPLLNPKTLGLTLSALADLHAITGGPHLRHLATALRERLVALRSPGWSGACWGYPFDWQARSFFLPAGTPTVVCTAFVAAGLWRAAIEFSDAECARLARSACDFVLRDLQRTPSAAGWTFSYSPRDHAVIHNASALGAALLATTARQTGEPALAHAAEPAWASLLDAQAEDGSWPYGAAAHHGWVDGLHTGYILEALADAEPAADSEAAAALRRGLEYYRGRMFDAEGLPLDRSGSRPSRFETHGAAEALLVLARFGVRDPDGRPAVQRLATFLLARMRGSDGLFADLWAGRPIRRTPDGFARWTQAWMLRALAGVARATA